MKLNNAGIFAFENGELVHWSERSAVSGAILRAGSVSVPIPDMPDVFFRVSHGEYAKLTESQIEHVKQEALKIVGTTKQAARGFAKEKHAESNE